MLYVWLLLLVAGAHVASGAPTCDNNVKKIGDRCCPGSALYAQCNNSNPAQCTKDPKGGLHICSLCSVYGNKCCAGSTVGGSCSRFGETAQCYAPTIPGDLLDCKACGFVDQPCCVKPVLQGYYDAVSRCSVRYYCQKATTTCQRCGRDLGQRCCPGDKVGDVCWTPSSIGEADATCKVAATGVLTCAPLSCNEKLKAGATCCPGSKAYDSCGKGNVVAYCKPAAPGAPLKCTACSGIGQKCCPGVKVGEACAGNRSPFRTPEVPGICKPADIPGLPVCTAK